MECYIDEDDYTFKKMTQGMDNNQEGMNGVVYIYIIIYYNYYTTLQSIYIHSTIQSTYIHIVLFKLYIIYTYIHIVLFKVCIYIVLCIQSRHNIYILYIYSVYIYIYIVLFKVRGGIIAISDSVKPICSCDAQDCCMLYNCCQYNII